MTVAITKPSRPFSPTVGIAVAVRRGSVAIISHMRCTPRRLGSSDPLDLAHLIARMGDEAIASLDVATAMNYIEDVSPELLDRMRHVQAVLTKLTK